MTASAEAAEAAAGAHCAACCRGLSASSAVIPAFRFVAPMATCQGRCPGHAGTTEARVIMAEARRSCAAAYQLPPVRGSRQSMSWPWLISSPAFVCIDLQLRIFSTARARQHSLARSPAGLCRTDGGGSEAGNQYTRIDCCATSPATAKLAPTTTQTTDVQLAPLLSLSGWRRGTADLMEPKHWQSGQLQQQPAPAGATGPPPALAPASAVAAAAGNQPGRATQAGAPPLASSHRRKHPAANDQQTQQLLAMTASAEAAEAAAAFQLPHCLVWACCC